MPDDPGEYDFNRQFPWARGRYTPWGKEQITQMPSNVGGPEAGAYYSPRSWGAGYNGGVSFSKAAAQQPSTQRHEYGHMFDERLGVTGYNQSNPGFGWGSQYGRPDYQRYGQQYPGMNMGAVRENPFLGYALGERRAGNMQDFPGMFGTPRAPFDANYTWGGRGEMYAEMNADPASIPPNMRMFFPQFTDEAYDQPAHPARGGMPPLYAMGTHPEYLTMQGHPYGTSAGWGAAPDYLRTPTGGPMSAQDQGQPYGGVPEQARQAPSQAPTQPPRKAPPGYTWRREQFEDGSTDWILRKANAR